jgi:hypothetical protein
LVRCRHAEYYGVAGVQHESLASSLAFKPIGIVSCSFALGEVLAVVLTGSLQSPNLHKRKTESSQLER